MVRGEWNILHAAVRRILALSLVLPLVSGVIGTKSIRRKKLLVLKKTSKIIKPNV